MKTCTLCGREGERGFQFDYVSKSLHCSNKNACRKRYQARGDHSRLMGLEDWELEEYELGHDLTVVENEDDLTVGYGADGETVNISKSALDELIEMAQEETPPTDYNLLPLYEWLVYVG